VIRAIERKVGRAIRLDKKRLGKLLSAVLSEVGKKTGTPREALSGLKNGGNICLEIGVLAGKRCFGKKNSFGKKVRKRTLLRISKKERNKKRRSSKIKGSKTAVNSWRQGGEEGSCWNEKREPHPHEKKSM